MKTQALLKTVISLLKKKRVEYGEVRFDIRDTEAIVIENGSVKSIFSSQSAGIGIRVLCNGAWGFSSTPFLTAKALENAALQAVGFAKEAARLSKLKVVLAKRKPIIDSYTAPFLFDPFVIPISQKLEDLFEAHNNIKKNRYIKHTKAEMHFFKTKKLFLDTYGSCIKQQFIESGAGLEVTATKNNESQKRSYPNSHGGQHTQMGYEYIKMLNLNEGAQKISKEVLELLDAPACPSMETTLLIDGPQMALQVHESCGHPTELDRVLGEERSFAGTSFLTPEKLNSFRYGSKIVNIHANALAPHGLGGFRYDDEGTPAQDNPIIKNGIFCGYLSSRQTAKVIKRKSSGAMRSSGWNMIPIIRMTNVNLLPHQGTFDEIIKDTKKGLLVSVNKSWSIDDKRLNFQFGCEYAREIKNGKLGKIFKNPVYTDVTPKFWNRCSAIAGESDWYMWGVPNCGKGEPMQTAHVGHGVSPARFEKVKVFSQ